MKWLARLAGMTVAAAAAVAAIFLLGMRAKNPAVVNRVRRFNRAVTNPRVLRSAGQPGASASVIRHVGRVSGRHYETPVGPFAVGDDFVIALPYGPRTDWVRNVVHEGGAVLVHEGRTIQIHDPEVILVEEVIADLPPGEQRTLRLFGVEACLRVRASMRS